MLDIAPQRRLRDTPQCSSARPGLLADARARRARSVARPPQRWKGSAPQRRLFRSSVTAKGPGGGRSSPTSRALLPVPAGTPMRLPPAATARPSSRRTSTTTTKRRTYGVRLQVGVRFRRSLKRSPSGNAQVRRWWGWTRGGSQPAPPRLRHAGTRRHHGAVAGAAVTTVAPTPPYRARRG